jgi:CRISPR-associated protein Cas2
VDAGYVGCIVSAITRRQCYLAAYDISETRRRSAALRLVRCYATGWQKSFFECFLSSSEEKALLVKLAAILDPRRDRFLLIRLDPRLMVVSLGIAMPPSPGPFLLGGR